MKMLIHIIFSKNYNLNKHMKSSRTNNRHVNLQCHDLEFQNATFPQIEKYLYVCSDSCFIRTTRLLQRSYSLHYKVIQPIKMKTKNLCFTIHKKERQSCYCSILPFHTNYNHKRHWILDHITYFKVETHH